MSYLAHSDSFGYLCYGSTAIRRISLFQCGDRLQTSEPDLNRRQILTYKVDHPAGNVKPSCDQRVFKCYISDSDILSYIRMYPLVIKGFIYATQWIVTLYLI